MKSLPLILPPLVFAALAVFEASPAQGQSAYADLAAIDNAVAGFAGA